MPDTTAYVDAEDVQNVLDYLQACLRQAESQWGKDETETAFSILAGTAELVEETIH